MAERHSQAQQHSMRDEDINDSFVAHLDTSHVVATKLDMIGSAHCKCEACEVCRNRKRKRGSSATETALNTGHDHSEAEELELSILQCDTAQDRTSNILLANPRHVTEHAIEDGADDPAAEMGVVERIMGWLPLRASADVKNGIQDELQGVHEETLLAAMRWIALE
jgi:hypothetical protein